MEVTDVSPVSVASKFTITLPLVGDAVRFVPPVTVVTPLATAAITLATVTFLTKPASASYIAIVSALSAVAPKDA